MRFFGGLFVLICGIVFLLKPDIFRRWFWKRTDIAQRVLSAEAYIRYMRGMGILSIVLGIVVILLHYLG